MEKVKIYSLFSGTLYEVYEREIVNLGDGHIPLDKFPKVTCKNCYGRGYTHYDKDRSIYPICQCMLKCIKEGYQHSQIRLLPKL